MRNLEELRAEIDKIDTEILALLSKRQKVVKQVADFKKQHQIQVFDQKREQYLHEFHNQLSKQFGLSITFIYELFDLIMDESKRLQQLECSRYV